MMPLVYATPCCARWIEVHKNIAKKGSTSNPLLPEDCTSSQVAVVHAAVIPSHLPRVLALKLNISAAAPAGCLRP
jgi:hypothetical protein